jgi:hypothetical protein
MEVEAYLGALTYHVALLRDFHPSNFTIIGETLLMEKSGGKSGHVGRFISKVIATIDGLFLEFHSGDEIIIGKDITIKDPVPADIRFLYIGGFPFLVTKPNLILTQSSGIIRVNHRVIGAITKVGELKI